MTHEQRAKKLIDELVLHTFHFSDGSFTEKIYHHLKEAIKKEILEEINK